MDIITINFDTLKKDHWSEEQTNKARFMVDFVQHLMNNHDLDYIKQTYGDSPYVQHNQNMVTGIDGIIREIRGLIKRFPDYTYDVKHIYVDGDDVIFHSHATVNKKHRGNGKFGYNIHDVWKVQDGKIVEHWDSLQPINLFMRFFTLFLGGRILNKNGVF